MNFKKSALAAAVGTALAVASSMASAISVENSSLTFLLTSDHCSGTCGGGANPQPSFGTIVVTDLPGDVLGFNITLINGNKFVQTGLDLTFGFNLAGNPTLTYSGLSSGFTIPGGTSPTQTSGTYHENGTGNFQYGVVWGGGGGGGNADTNPVLSFSVTGTGLTLASLQQNAVGQYFAADIISGTTGNTGAVDASLVTSVPEPETYATMLAGLGLLGFVAARRKNVAT
jgi:hypothetical protein